MAPSSKSSSGGGPIPMRGNEEQWAYWLDLGKAMFPIPMRGNESEHVTLSVEADVVSDPHEG